MALRAGGGCFPPIVSSPRRRATRKEKMNDEIERIVKGVLLNTEAQEKWIGNASAVLLTSLDVFADRHLEESCKSKKSAFRLGVIVGALYEQSQERRNDHGRHN